MPSALVKPPRLSPGDTVAAVSLSWGGPSVFPNRFEAGKRQLEETFGLRLIPSRHALADAQWLAANPRARADDLMEVMSDSSIRGAIASIGGDDSIRLLPFLDFAVLRANPKIVLGFSDTTVTHFAMLRAGVGSFYGPAIMAGFAENGGMFPYTIDSVRKTLFSSSPIGEIRPNPGGWTDEVLSWADAGNQSRTRARKPNPGWQWLQGIGVHKGRLIGGCLEVLDWLRGTPVWPAAEEWAGAVLFLETSEEMPPPRDVTRMLRNMAATGALWDLRGILIGRPFGAEKRFGEYDKAILEFVRQELGREDVPVIAHMDFGHTDPMLVLPYGAETVLDTTRREISIIEAAVADEKPH